MSQPTVPELPAVPPALLRALDVALARVGGVLALPDVRRNAVRVAGGCLTRWLDCQRARLQQVPAPDPGSPERFPRWSAPDGAETWWSVVTDADSYGPVLRMEFGHRQPQVANFDEALPFFLAGLAACAAHEAGTVGDPEAEPDYGVPDDADDEEGSG